jgi:hypothetical protein
MMLPVIDVHNCLSFIIYTVNNTVTILLKCYACNETNLMHYLSSVYSVTIPLHVLGLLVAHHQEVTMYTRVYPKYSGPVLPSIQ